MGIDPSDVNAIAFGIAFLAGLLSFLSPCVLPLVPAYIGYLSGATVAEGRLTVDSRRTTFSHAVAFVAGFSVLFIFVFSWLGVAQFLVQQYSGGSSAAISGLDFAVKDLLVRVGTVLLGVMAVRVADSTLGGEWRIRLGNTILIWPDRVVGLPQKYVRWGLVGLLLALVYVRWLAFSKPSAEIVALEALMLGLLPLAGVGLSATGALILGVAVAGINTWSWQVNPLSMGFGRLEWSGVALQAVLIVLVVYYVSRTSLFYSEKRFEVGGRLRNKGYLTSGLMGAVFGAGWTPCTGPNLMVILALAGSAGSLGVGLGLLSTYALGLGVPFLLVGLAFGAATATMRRIMPYMAVIKTVNTLLLLFMAALILSGTLQTLAGAGGFTEDLFGIGL